MAIFKLACPDHPEMKLCADERCSSEIVTGEHAGKAFDSYIQERGSIITGTDANDFDHFPYMISWLKPQEPELFNPNKAKLWIVLSAQEGSSLYLGANKPIPMDWENNVEIVDDLNPVHPYPEEVFFIEPGLLAAAGSGVTLLSIEQEANLHEVPVQLEPYDFDTKIHGPHTDDGQSQSSELCNCDHFAVYKTRVDGRVSFDTDKASCASIVMIDGSAIVEHDSQSLHVQCGDTVFIEADTPDVKVTGNCTYIFTRI